MSKIFDRLELILIFIIIVLGVAFGFQVVETEKYIQENKALKEAQVLEYAKGYRDAELAYIEDYIDVLEAYWEMFAEASVLEERIEWLENQDHHINIEDIMWDLDDLMEYTIRYYEVEPQEIRDVMELFEYIQWKIPEVYERILNWWGYNGY